jgi:hypothetical protein
MQWACAFWFFLVCNLVVLIWSVVKYEQSRFVEHTSPTQRCNVDKWCHHRDPNDVSWICCEDDMGWPVSHTLAPMTLMLLTNNIWFSLAMDMFWEVIETSELSLGDGMLFEDEEAGGAMLETNAGQLIADVLMCGVPGILLATLIINWTGWRGLDRRYRAGNETSVFWKYVLASALSLAIWVFPNFASHRHSVNYGEIIAVSLQSIFILWFWPMVLRTTDVPDGDDDPREEYFAMRWWWLAATLLIGLAGPGYIFLYNVFYQIWVGTYFLILLLMFLLFVRPVLLVCCFRHAAGAAAAKKIHKQHRVKGSTV